MQSHHFAYGMIESLPVLRRKRCPTKCSGDKAVNESGVELSENVETLDSQVNEFNEAIEPSDDACQEHCAGFQFCAIGELVDSGLGDDEGLRCNKRIVYIKNI